MTRFQLKATNAAGQNFRDPSAEKRQVNLSQFGRSPRVLTVLLFGLSVLAGCCVFQLQSLSIFGLLDVIGLKALPVLLLSQSIISWLFLRVFGHALLARSQSFVASSFVMGALISFASIHAQWGEGEAPSAQVFGLLFIGAQLTISALRMGVHVTLSRQISILKNPQVSVQLSIAEESGFLLGVLGLVAFPELRSKDGSIFQLLPFIAATLVFVAIQLRAKAPLKEIFPNPKLFEQLGKLSRYFRPAAQGQSLRAAPRSYRPYLSPLIQLFAVISAMKVLQWFGMAYGLDLAVSEGSTVVKVFSRLSLVQSSATLIILLASLRFSSRIPAWSLGFKVLLGAQAVLSLGLFVVPSALLLMGSEVVRKVLEHGFMSRSLQLLTASIPEEDRLETRHLMERWSVTAGTAAVALVSFVALHSLVGFQIIWLGAAALCAWGLKLRHRLFRTLNDFHLSNLNQESLAGVIQSCSVLGHPESQNHYAALVHLLARQPRPVIVKNLLYALGRMRNPKALDSILSFLEASREDIQIASIRAAQNYQGHEINLRLLRLLRDVCRAQMAIKSNVVHELTQRLGLLAVPYILELFDSSKDERVTANAVEILGEISAREKDEDLRVYLSRFLKPQHPRRVRANAAVVLYDHPEYCKEALEVFDCFMTSTDQKELGSFAYMAGILELRAYEPVIFRMSAKVDHTDSTLLVALLRLRNQDVIGILAQWIVGSDDAKAHEALVRLSGVHFEIRSQIFEIVLTQHGSWLDLVLVRMRRSQRDFDYDREMIRQEALRLGIKLSEEDAWKETDPNQPKVA